MKNSIISILLFVLFSQCIATAQLNGYIQLHDGNYFTKDKDSSIGITYEDTPIGTYQFEGRKLVFRNDNADALMAYNYDYNLLHPQNGTIWVTNESNPILGAHYGVASWAYGDERNTAGWFVSPVDNMGSYALRVDGDVTVTGSMYFPSDRTLKEDIHEIPDVLQLIRSLSPKSYYYKADQNKTIQRSTLPQGKQYGLIAQEVSQVFPHLVTKKYRTTSGAQDPFREQEEYQAVNYIGLIPILVKAIKEQQTIIEQSNERLALLEEKIDYNTIDNPENKSEYLLRHEMQLLQAYPNPSHNVVTIRYSTPVNKNAILVLTNQTGQPIYTSNLIPGSKQSTELDTSSYPNGIYYYYMEVGSAQSAIKKLVIQH